MGNGHWAIEEGKRGKGKGKRGKGEMPHAPCPMPHAPCPIYPIQVTN
ncbi:hypothetical protein [Tolypothrix sp. VBCCA 56010]